MKNSESAGQAVAAIGLSAICALWLLFPGRAAIADGESFTTVCEGRETDNSGRLSDPTTKPRQLTFSVQLSFELMPEGGRVFLFDEKRWISLSEVSEYRLAFDWHSDFDNVASIDRYTNIYRFTKVTDKSHLHGANDLIVTRTGKCHEIPYVSPPL
jgi:hypothetical protein